MVKVYFKSLSLYIFGLVINFLILEFPFAAVAQNSTPPVTQQAANPRQIDLEPEILSEINRVRTNPQGYAQWLEEQRQYYDGIWLKLPGEKPIRTNKGLKALNEAISALKEQQPLAALDISDTTLATANAKLDNFATANNIQNISYGRVTPKGIVMSIVVDELFPDRRRRKSLLSSHANDTGVVCKPDPRYAKVCAIAYSDTEANAEVAAAKPEPAELTAASEPEAAANRPETEVPANPPAPSENSEVDDSSNEETTAEVATAKPETPAKPTPASEPETAASRPETEVSANPPAPSENSEVDDSSNEETTAEVAAAKPETPAKPTPASEPETAASQPKTEVSANPPAPSENSEVDDSSNEETTAALPQPPQPQTPPTPEVTLPNPETESETDESEVTEMETEAESEEIAIDTDNVRSLNSVERGALEDGDRTIPDDGSFYDSYPIEGKSGDSVTILLESDEFDPFVALIDDKGNIIEQNDDIDEEDSNSKIEVTIPQDGAYNVIVNAYDEGGKGEYVLTLSQ